MEAFSQNELYNRDCLGLLKEFVEQRGEFVDLVYIDPPFNSKKDRYNDKGELSFIDTWTNVPYKDVLEELRGLNGKLHDLIEMIAVSEADLSYLTNLGLRILYMYKVLKTTASFYVHCDPTMSHYIKIVCDFVFGKQNFKNDLIWQRVSGSRSSKATANKFPVNHDNILFYVKSKKYTFNKLYTPYSEDYVKGKFTHDDNDGLGRYRWQVLATYSQERLLQLQGQNRVRKSDLAKNYEMKQYLSESKGNRIPDIWIDKIEPINPNDKSLNGYATQKPEELIQRIILSSANPGDIFADFFVGSGSSISVAEKMKLKWVACDLNLDAIQICKKRIKEIVN